ncbi:hypothetical protein AMIS_19540 [Actinoplanes missouriensis 431]|uniref:Uncharacterized protein n=1 Tax=Actinoplanes missouriensis (strain ATCC 14538 / DSM 43046 / CBS 188.64 / JCM 3121 / NBRC 102363 / NCIMB 12654 / NRRL B-3342 / UNCC 431) TaxID=512565 RepID=I0H2D7_ACTM4|nr:hypothetical protein [Actinoplanes missouriensis]BAL87174.1 hypothetical protein AMIS_19540 [Actinoplanes missouriensis 431]
MTRDEHLAQMYITGTHNRLKQPTALTVLCASCGTEHHTDSISVAAVIATATAHISKEAS